MSTGSTPNVIYADDYNREESVMVATVGRASLLAPQLKGLTREHILSFKRARQAYEKAHSEVHENNRNRRGDGGQGIVSIRSSQTKRLWTRIGKLMKCEIPEEMSEQDFNRYVEIKLTDDVQWTVDAIEKLLEAQLVMETQWTNLDDRILSIITNMDKIIEDKGLEASLDNDHGKKMLVNAFIDSIQYQKPRDMVKDHVMKDKSLKTDLDKTLEYALTVSKQIQAYDGVYIAAKKGKAKRTLGECRKFYQEMNDKKKLSFKRKPEETPKRANQGKKQKTGQHENAKGKPVDGNQKREVKCLKCQESHKVFDCPKISGIEEAKTLFHDWMKKLKELRKSKS